MWINTRPIEGNHITLEPLQLEHVPELIEAVKDGASWKLWYANVPCPKDMQQYVEAAMAAVKHGDVAYAVRVKPTGQIVGTTRFYNVDAANKRAMIGYTWYADSARRTRVNTECKVLMLQALFETHGAIAVEFRTHSQNTTSRQAIERLGAKQDGILRHHQIMPDGSLRDTVVYSILAEERLAVKRTLSSKLN